MLGLTTGGTGNVYYFRLVLAGEPVLQGQCRSGSSNDCNLVLGDKTFCISKYLKFPNNQKAKGMYLHNNSRAQPAHANCSSD